MVKVISLVFLQIIIPLVLPSVALAVIVSTFIPNEPYTSKVDLGVDVPIPICAKVLLLANANKITMLVFNKCFIVIDMNYMGKEKDDSIFILRQIH